jgi:6-pyruvoyl-tetrahydropterin synthase
MELVKSYLDSFETRLEGMSKLVPVSLVPVSTHGVDQITTARYIPLEAADVIKKLPFEDRVLISSETIELNELYNEVYKKLEDLEVEILQKVMAHTPITHRSTFIENMKKEIISSFDHSTLQSQRLEMRVKRNRVIGMVEVFLWDKISNSTTGLDGTNKTGTHARLEGMSKLVVLVSTSSVDHITTAKYVPLEAAEVIKKLPFEDRVLISSETIERNELYNEVYKKLEDLEVEILQKVMAHNPITHRSAFIENMKKEIMASFDHSALQSQLLEMRVKRNRVAGMVEVFLRDKISNSTTGLDGAKKTGAHVNLSRPGDSLGENALGLK